MLGVVVRITGWDPSAGEQVVLQAASHDDPAVCHLGGTTWWPAISKLPTLRYDLFDGAFSGTISTPSSTLTLAVEPWPDFARYALADASFELWTGEVGAPFAQWTQRFDGRLTEQPAIGDGVATIAFAADDRWLDRPLLELYEGTGGDEGGAGLKGTPKPLAIGAPRYVPGVLVDAVDTILQVSAYGPIMGTDVALERLNRFGPPVADYPNFATLKAVSIAPGAWATCNAEGFVRHGAPLEGQPSYLMRGDRSGVSGWARTPGAVIKRIAQIAGASNRVSDTSLATLDLLSPYPISLWLAEQVTVRDIIQRIAASVNAVAGVSWLGELFVVPIGLGAPTTELRSDGTSLPPTGNVDQIAIAQPYWRVALQAERAWQVHALSDVAFGAELIERGPYNAIEVYREGSIVTLPDGSRWLYVAATPTAGNLPQEGSAYWTVLTEALPFGKIEEIVESIERIVSDGFLSRAEKPQAGIDWNALAADLNALNARYGSLGSPPDLAAVRDDANNRFTALSTYLSALDPPWYDTTTDSPINAATYRQRWIEAHVAMAAFRAAITGRKGDTGWTGAGAWTHISNNPEAGAVAEPNRAYTTGPRQDWGTYATQSIERFTNGCICSGTLPPSHDDRVHVGLTSHPASGLSYQRLSFALSRESDGTMVTWVESGQRTAIGTFTGQVDWSVEYDGTNIIWKVNGTVRDTFYWPNNLPLFFATALAGNDPRVINLAFAKTGSAGKDGSPGAPGEDGTDGFIVDTETPVFAIQCFSDGTPKPTWQGGVGTIRLVKGGQVVAADAYDLVSNQNMAGLALSGNQFRFMGITADQGQFVARAFYGGQVYTRTISAKKVRDGEAAFKATSGYGQTGSFPNETVLTTASTPVPGGRGVTLSASASYGINGNVPSQWVGTMRIYWRNITDGGPWNLLDQQDGSIAIVENVGTPQEPRYERENGAVGCSGSFTMPAQDKQIGYEVRIQRRGGAGTVVLSGNAQLAVSS